MVYEVYSSTDYKNIGKFWLLTKAEVVYISLVTRRIRTNRITTILSGKSNPFIILKLRSSIVIFIGGRDKKIYDIAQCLSCFLDVCRSIFA